MHLCDIHYEKGNVDIVEVGILSPGNDITTFLIDGIKCGLAICYDVEFDEFIKIYGKVGKSLSFTWPYQFNSTNGFSFMPIVSNLLYTKTKINVVAIIEFVDCHVNNIHYIMHRMRSSICTRRV